MCQSPWPDVYPARSFFHENLIHLLVLVSLLFSLTCGGGPTQEAPKEKARLNVFIWADYLDPALVKEFEEKNQCKVVLSYFDSNELLLAKLTAGANGYDVIYPSSYMVNIMVKKDMLLPLDHGKLSNLANIDPNYLPLVAEADMAHSVPYMVSTTGIGYVGSLGEIPTSWSALEDPRVSGRMTILNDARESLGAALRYHGFSLNSTNEEELAQARDQVILWKKNVARMDNDQYHYGLANGEFLMTMGYGGDILQAQQQNPDIRFMLPKEGFAFTCDQMVIPKDSNQVELAHAWINFLHDPEVAARNTQFTKFLCPNKASYEKLPEALRNNPAIFPPPEVLQRAEYIQELGEDLAKFTKAWDEVKAAQ